MNAAIIEAPTHQLSTVLTVQQALAHVHLVQSIVGEVMKKGEHYGESFPGDKKMNLLKPGADKLCLTFQLSPSYEINSRDLPNAHREHEVRCKLTSVAGRVIAEGVGSCSTMESKYRWRNAPVTCPECGVPAIIKGRAEYGGGWVCFNKKGGCGAKWPDGAQVIEGQKVGKVENPDPADQYNTVLKIAKKRAYVDATISAVAASDLFTQDLEDIEQRQDAAAAKADKQQAAQPQEASPAAPKAQAAPAAAPRPATASTASAGSTMAAKPNPAASPATKSAAPTAPANAPAGQQSINDMAAAAAAGPGKSECDALFLQLTKRVERHLAINLWGAKLGVVDRHAQLKRALEDIDKIHTAIPRERAEELIADLAAKHGITKTTVGDPAFALALSAAATGDAATIDAAKGATAAGDVDEPPF